MSLRQKVVLLFILIQVAKEKGNHPKVQYKN